MMLLALLSPAFALVAREPCMGFYAAESIPGPGATDVPVDVIPTFIFYDQGCATTMAVDLELYRYDDTDANLIGSSSETLVGSGPLVLSLDLLEAIGPLEPLTNYVVRTVPVDGVMDATAIGFTTGEGTLAGLSGEPQLRMVNADANKDEGVWTLSGEVLVDPASDPDGLSILTIPHPDEDRLLAASVITGSGLFTEFISFTVEDVPDELCLQVEQFDGAQRSSGLSESDCLEVDKHRSLRGGCSTSAAAAGLGPTLLAMLLAALGRRSR